MAVIVFWTSAFLLFMTWIGYPMLVIGFASLRPTRARCDAIGRLPTFSVIVAAYNEEKNIGSRIRSLLVEAPNALEILIGCDGCTDKTAEIARTFGGKVRVLEFPTNRGRALVHNDCVAQAKGEVVLFTDAETRFGDGCVEKLLAAFRDPTVGAVSGRIVYVNAAASPIGQSARAYWDLEERLRVAESKLDILGFGTGAVLALRKDLYRPIGATEDIDYAATLDIALGGYRILYEPSALAFDYISESVYGAARTRARQTSRSFLAIGRRLLSQRALGRPGVLLAGLFHKTFRHFTLAFLLGCLLGNVGVLTERGFYFVALVLQVIFYGLAFVGFVLHVSGKGSTRLVNIPYNFVAQSLFRIVGLFRGLARRGAASYTTVR